MRDKEEKAQQNRSKSNKKLGGLVKDLIDSMELNSYADKLEKEKSVL